MVVINQNICNIDIAIVIFQKLIMFKQKIQTGQGIGHGKGHGKGHSPGQGHDHDKDQRPLTH